MHTAVLIKCSEYLVLDSSEYFPFPSAPNPKHLNASLHAAESFLINLLSPRLSRFNPNIYLVQCHIALLTCQLSSPYVKTHDLVSHPYIHFFKFFLNIIKQFYLTSDTGPSVIVAKVLYVFRNSVRVTCCTHQRLSNFIIQTISEFT